jgi:hypothetical protein
MLDMKMENFEYFTMTFDPLTFIWIIIIHKVQSPQGLQYTCQVWRSSN